MIECFFGNSENEMAKKLALHETPTKFKMWETVYERGTTNSRTPMVVTGISFSFNDKDGSPDEYVYNACRQKAELIKEFEAKRPSCFGEKSLWSIAEMKEARKGDLAREAEELGLQLVESKKSDPLGPPNVR